MTRSLSFVLLFLAASLAHAAGVGSGPAARAQTDTAARLLYTFKVNGVGLRDTYEHALRRLGEPQRTQRERRAKGCGGPHTALTLDYPGLQVGLRGTAAGRDFRVVSFEVTSPDWEVTPGPVPFGMHADEVLALVGEPSVNLADSGGRALIYMTQGKERGGVALRFRGDDRLVEISWRIHCDAQ
jgi:hypothetical protein